MIESSDIYDFLETCEMMISQVKGALDSPHDFKKASDHLAKYIDENWTVVSEKIINLKSNNALDANLKIRLESIFKLLRHLESKAQRKNDWVNEFKEYIIKPENLK